MITVGIRNLKNSLSHYVGLVKSGETVLVTQHDKVVAKIVPSSVGDSASDILRTYVQEQANSGSLVKATKRTKLVNKRPIHECDEHLLQTIYAETREDRA